MDSAAAARSQYRIDLMYLFDRDTTPTDQGLIFGDSWNIGDKPNGGYIMAAVARNMCAHSGVVGSPHVDPVTITTHYLRPGEPGPAEVRTETLRIGRTFTNATAGLFQGTAQTLRTQTIATFGNLGDLGEPQYLEISAPDIPPPDACISRNDPMFANLSKISDSTEVRLHPNTGWMSGTPNGRPQSIGWIRLRDGRDPDPWSLLYFADALPPTVFEILPDRAWVPTIEMTVHVRAKPAPGWILARMTSRHVADGKFEEDGELWDSTGRLVAQSRQLAMILQP
jgi:acyl-CoA thioesterase